MKEHKNYQSQADTAAELAIRQASDDSDNLAPPTIDLMDALRKSLLPSTPLTQFFFTFGGGHVGFPGYVEVYARTIDEAHGKMHLFFGHKWAFDYTKESDIDEMDRFKKVTLW